MVKEQTGRYRARFAANAGDVRSAQALRYLCFRQSVDGGAPGRLDQDGFDDHCHHVLIEDVSSKQLVCCFRLMLFSSGRDIQKSYAAQFYDLSKLAKYAAPLLEMGRFCLAPEVKHLDILRLAWGIVTRYVDENKVAILIGCSSFEGVDAEKYTGAFALLRQNHQGPDKWMPTAKFPDRIEFDDCLEKQNADLRSAMQHMPPLLRSYLAMGGWVSDHAVVDHDLNTLHVFTGLEIKSIPAGRARLLRSVLA